MIKNLVDVKSRIFITDLKMVSFALELFGI